MIGLVTNSSPIFVNQAKKMVMAGKLPPFEPTREEIYRYLNDMSIESNRPETYAKYNLVSEFVFGQIKTLDLKKDDPILELGCNVGRNLNYLYQHGFNNLHGIELSSTATSTMKKFYPEMVNRSTILEGTIEDKIKEIKDGSMALTFSNNVLYSIHPYSNFVFDDIARISSKYVMTIEVENSYYWGMFPRDYGLIFTKLGFKMLEDKLVSPNPSVETNRHTLRIFKR